MIVDASLAAPETPSRRLASTITAKSRRLNEIGNNNEESRREFVSDVPVYSALLESKMYQDYHDAFETSTGLPLSLRRPGEELGCTPPEKHAAGSPSSALKARMNCVGEDSFAHQIELEQEARFGPRTLKCFAGLCETAVPVRAGEKLVAFLQTGGILNAAPSEPHFSKIARELLRRGSSIDLKQAEIAYYNLRVLTSSQYQAMIKLLSTFATPLGACAERIILHRADAQRPAVAHVRQIIEAGFTEDLSLADVARWVNVSAGYFSALFKTDTGLNFIEYVARLRVGKAEILLHNSTLRISDVAFDVGFQSLSQFNRNFQRFAGSSPRAYRASHTRAAMSTP